MNTVPLTREGRFGPRDWRLQGRTCSLISTHREECFWMSAHIACASDTAKRCDACYFLGNAMCSHRKNRRERTTPMRQDYPVYLFFLSSCVITLSFYVLQGGGWSVFCCFVVFVLLMELQLLINGVVVYGKIERGDIVCVSSLASLGNTTLIASSFIPIFFCALHLLAAKRCRGEALRGLR